VTGLELRRHKVVDHRTNEITTMKEGKVADWKITVAADGKSRLSR
jgi:hypothetical protein